FLPNRYIYTIYRLTCIVKFFLVQNGIDTNGRFTCLTVTNNKLTLATAHRNHCINRLNTSLKWLSYRLTVNYTRSFTLQWHFISFTGDWTFTIDRLTQCVYHTTNNTFTYFK